jgi:hypothetical protein
MHALQMSERSGRCLYPAEDHENKRYRLQFSVYIICLTDLSEKLPHTEGAWN